jgi:hypothetical protein
MFASLRKQRLVVSLFLQERVKNKNPKNPWPRPDIVNIVLLSELYAKYFYSDNQLMSRQGGPVDPVKKFFSYQL